MGFRLDTKTRRRLQKGEIITDMEKKRRGTKVRRAVAHAVIDAPRERVWKVIGDFEHYKDFMPQTQTSEVLERSETEVLFKTTLKFAVKTIWYTIRLQLDPEAFEVEWEMEDGSIASNEGSWKLEEFDGDKTLAHYTLATDPGFPIPGFLLTRATKGTLPLVIEAVRKRVKDPRYA